MFLPVDEEVEEVEVVVEVLEARDGGASCGNGEVGNDEPLINLLSCGNCVDDGGDVVDDEDTGNAGKDEDDGR